MKLPISNKMPFGGDYNPEQWNPSTWEEDMRLLKLAGIDIVTLNVFSWAALQKDETTYDFDTLDRIVDMVTEHGMQICMGTSTAVHPAWMAKKYPDVLRVDEEGRKRKFGFRHNSCPNSPSYRTYAARIAGKIAERYRKREAIVAWHINNEYGGMCYCENCEKAFRVWLKEKYKTIEAVNRAWNTSFWGHTFYAFDEIVLPNMLSEHTPVKPSVFQGITLDYHRFNSDSLLECYKLERDAVRQYSSVPCTTNLMGFFFDLDYHKWAKEMDFISWDNYPRAEDSIERAAMAHDLMRGLQQDTPFWLMEQTPGVSNWHPYCKLKRPGEMRLHSYQSVAHGADSVMFFQMKQSIGASEKYHSAIISHEGSEHTRIFRECAGLGEELNTIAADTLGTRTYAKAAILFDWDNWWVTTYSAGLTRSLDYVKEVQKYYRAFYELHINVDIISQEEDFSSYDLLIAPCMHMVKAGTAERLEVFTKSGGAFLTTCFSGYVDEHDLVVTGGYPGRLRKLLGIWVEECDALKPGTSINCRAQDSSWKGELLCDVIHPEGAEVLAVFEEEYYAGMPSVTKHRFGEGDAWYVGTSPEQEYLTGLIGRACEGQGIDPVLEVPGGVEAVSRQNDEHIFIFLMNHLDEERQIGIQQVYTDIITGTRWKPGERLKLQPKDVVILRRKLR